MDEVKNLIRIWLVAASSLFIAFTGEIEPSRDPSHCATGNSTETNDFD
jgi:hypothetical protein